VALAIVLDDSLSMRAQVGGKSRWDRAHKAARDLVSGARDGDSIGIVLAGSPPRIALASTTDIAAAHAVLDNLGPSDRGTDLAGALELGRALLGGLPQVDRRIVLLSDLADGHADDAALAESGGIPLWVPLEELDQPAPDCAVVRADRLRSQVSVRVACSSADAALGRAVELKSGDKVVGRAALPGGSKAADLSVEVHDAPADLTAVLTGADAIHSDDGAPVSALTGALSLAIVADPVGGKLVTGGPPAVEQALSSLELDAQIRPLPLLADHVEDLMPFAGIVLEDPAGLTPEARRSLGTWLERGGVALVALGPHAPLSPLGSSFEPLLAGAVSWGPSPSAGVDERAAALFGAAASGLFDLHPRGRATFDLAAQGASVKVKAQWKDGAPWLVERPIGRGLAFVLSLPTSVDESDLALRPAFLLLLESFVDAARARNGAQRTDVGQPWAFEGVRSLEVATTTPKGPGPKLPVVEEAGRKVVTPDHLGRYQITADADKLSRIVAPVERELDFRPRAVASSARSTSLGDVRARIDLSSYLAIALLGLLVLEIALRVWAQRGSTELEGSAAA
jgi:hypothetical protein